MKALIVIFGLVICSVIAEHEGDTEFIQYNAKYNRKYETEVEYLYRLAVFNKNMDLVSHYNRESGSSIYGITKFMHLTQDEFRAKYLMPKGKLVSTPNSMKRYLDISSVEDLPTQFDWNEKNAVTPVYDQGQCGSCWAFSATEAIESQWFLTNHSLPSLSPQQIVDCDKGRGDEGCNGGDTPTAYQYVIAAGGMDSMKDYPYTAEDDKCTFQVDKVVAKIKDWTYVSKDKDEVEMQQKLYANGPISICVDATIWQFYIGGVVTSLCGTSLDHCVLLTGYDDKYVNWLGETYKIWKIRNSWGSDWGENGYIYVERGYDLCGVADEPTLPIV